MWSTLRGLWDSYRAALRVALPHGQLNDIGTMIGAGASIIGGVMNKKAAGKAADAQTQSSEEAISELRRQYGITREDALKMYEDARRDYAPFRDVGLAANKRLAMLLGLDMPTGGAATMGSSSTRERLLEPTDSEVRDRVSREKDILNPDPGKSGRYYDNTDLGAIAEQEAHYREVIRQERAAEERGRLAEEERARAAREAENAAARADGPYGSLLRNFTAADIEADPVYQSGLKFGLDEGRDAINARAIAGGGYDSGATLKALTRYANDYGSTKAGGAFDRFMQNRASIYGMLTGQQGVGMGATGGITGAGAAAGSTIAGAGQNTARGVSDLITGAGNARAAGIVGGQNAWGNAAEGVNRAWGNYQNNQTLDKLLANRGYGGAPTGGGYSNYYNVAYGPGGGYNWG